MRHISVKIWVFSPLTAYVCHFDTLFLQKCPCFLTVRGRVPPYGYVNQISAPMVPCTRVHGSTGAYRGPFLRVFTPLTAYVCHFDTFFLQKCPCFLTVRGRVPPYGYENQFSASMVPCTRVHGGTEAYRGPFLRVFSPLTA